MSLRVRIVGGSPASQRELLVRLLEQGYAEAEDGSCDLVLVDVREGAPVDEVTALLAGTPGAPSAEIEQLDEDERHTVLLIEDDQFVRDVVRALVLRRGHTCFEAGTGREGLALAAVKAPHVIVLDRVLPDMDGLEVLRELHSQLATRSIPVILLTSRGDMHDRVEGLRAGADDYVVKPFTPAELLARVEGGLRRSRRDLAADPLTGLPGNAVVRDEVKRRVPDGVTVLYVDINEFKAYVDHYGFERASLAIQRLAQVLYNATVEEGAPGDLAGHIGGDDFLVVSDPDRAQPMTSRILTRFAEIAPELYDQEDRQRGYIDGSDRYGVERRFALMSLSVAIIDIEPGTAVRMRALGAFAAECKKLVKRVAGNASVRFNYATDGETP